MNVLKAFWKGDGGQALAEAALLILFIAIVCVLAVQTYGTGVRDLYELIAGGFAS
jgi:Flp pilus assembly pilin Flp